MNKYIRNIFSLIFNITVVGILIYVLKIYLVGGSGYSPRGISAFKFYTTDSNVLYALTCLITIPFNLLTIIKKENRIPKWVTTMRLYSTTTVAVTFFVVILLLGPFNPKGWEPLFTGMPFYLHLVVPLIAMVSFIAFDLYNDIDFKHCYYNLIPTGIYAIFYMIWVLGLKQEDHYMFFKFGGWATTGIFLGIFGLAFGMGVLLRYLNKLRNREK